MTDANYASVNYFDLLWKSFKHFLEGMAFDAKMQMNCDLLTLFREGNTSQISQIKRQCEGKMVDYVSRAKPWNPFAKGRMGRDLASELLIPRHLTARWQSGELRALK